MNKSTNEVEVLREDVAQLQADLKKLMGTVNGIGEDLANVVGAQTGRFVDDVEKKASRAYNQAAKEAHNYSRSFEKSVAEHPFGTAAIALAAGLLLSRFLDRSHR